MRHDGFGGITIGAGAAADPVQPDHARGPGTRRAILFFSRRHFRVLGRAPAV